MHACACTHTHVKPKNLAVILKPTTNIQQKKSNKTEFDSFEINLKTGDKPWDADVLFKFNTG